LFVTEPAAHSAHDASLELVDHLPGVHAVQLVAPRASPLSVIEPDWQLSQYVLPFTLVYLPDAHSMHACVLLEPPATSPYWPAAQSMHAEAAVEPVTATYLPIAQSVQSEAALDPIVVTYFPRAQWMQSEASSEPVASAYVPAAH
jgi:hypothetical protein